MTERPTESNEAPLDFNEILHRFAPQLQKVCSVSLRLGNFSSAPGVKHMRQWDENVGAHIAVEAFQLNTTPEGNVCYVETFMSKTGTHAVVSYDTHDRSLTLDLYPPLGVKGKRTLILNQENVPQPVSYNGRAQFESEMIHAEHLAQIEQVFQKHVFPWIEQLGDQFVSGVVGLTSRQVRGVTLAGNGGMKEAHFENPAGPYPRN